MKQKKLINILLIIIAIAFITTVIYAISTKQKLSLSPAPTSTSTPATAPNNIIQQNSFSKNETELIIETIEKFGAKGEKILQINKMTNSKVGVMTGNPDSYGPKRGGATGYSSGTIYYLIKNDGNWEIESTSTWVE